MSVASILSPVFVRVGLTFFLGFRFAIERRSAVLRRDVRLADMASGQEPWPDRIQKMGNCFRNRFEVPALSYTVVAFASITRMVDVALVVLEWLFVGSRIAHAFVPTTSNHVPNGYRVFVLRSIGLLAMWVIFAIRILVGAA